MMFTQVLLTVLMIKGLAADIETNFNSTYVKAIVVEFDGLTEIDSNGNSVGKTGKVKHSFNSFASQTFTISSPVETTYENISVSNFNFSSTLSGLSSTLNVAIYIFMEDGTIAIDSESYDYKKGMVKFNVELSNWQWCDPCTKGQTTENGNGIDVAIVMKGKGSSKKTQSSNSTRPAKYSLGDNQVLVASAKVQVDGNWQDLASGYPSMTTQGSKQIFRIRIPKFTNDAVYDPGFNIAGSVTGDSGLTGGSSGSSGSGSGSSGSGGSGFENGGYSGSAGFGSGYNGIKALILCLLAPLISHFIAK